jgi:PKD repeat protein/DNA-binding MarR family transcriptional regulator
MSSRVTLGLLCLFVALCLGGLAPSVVQAAALPSATTLPVSLSATPSAGSAPLQVAFQATVNFGTPTGYNWTFGDGTYLNGTNISDARPSHVYATPGTYTASVRVWEGTEGGNASIGVHVTASPLVLHVTATPDTGTAPLTVTFQGMIIGGSETYVAFNWSFGDGGSGVGPTIQYTYLRAGHYYVVLEVEDSEAAEVRQGVWVNVSANEVTPSAQVTGLGAFGWAVVGFSVGLVVAIVAFPVRSWLLDRRARSRSHPAPGPNRPGPAAAAPAAAVAASAKASGSPSAPPAQSAPAEAFRLSQRIVLHLATQGSPGPYDVALPGTTQAGMSTALGVRQNALTNVLRRLIDGGVIEEEVRHVRAQPRRLKTYRLTSRGELLARELRHRPPRAPSS